MSQTIDEGAPSAVAARRDLAYRNDLDGIRALAIVLVVAFHAHLPGFDGGFVGVDVFFVLSGWLITRQLLGPIEGGGSVGLVEFWCRRIRRLVPAMAVMILGVMAASVVLLSPLEWSQIAKRAAAAALYVSNLVFAHSAGNYFAGSLQSSPFLHTWSLGVEEQFYLVWPLAFWAAARAGRRRGIEVGRRSVIGFMAVVLVVSFAWGAFQTGASPYWAFFGLPSRAWEFAVGGLAVALLPGPVGRSPWWRSLTWVGVALIVAATLAFDEATPFPGVAALVPVVGALAVIVGGQVRGAEADPLQRGLRLRPVQWLGRLSYSWYLWHWPFIVLAVEASFDDSVELRTVAALASLPVAVASHRWIEGPARRSPVLVASRWKTLVAGAAVTALVVVAAGGLELYTRRQLASPPYEGLAAAASSFSDTDCQARSTPGGLGFCEAGDLDADRTVVLLGDSHAMQWMAAFGQAGERSGVRVLLRQAGNCTAVRPPGGGGAGTTLDDCRAFQDDTVAFLDEVQPDAIVVSDARNSRDLMFGDDRTGWGEAFAAQADAWRADGIAVGAIDDNPADGEPLVCLARGDGEDACTPTRAEATERNRQYADGEAIAFAPSSGPVAVLPVTDVVCGVERCALRRDGEYVFAATGHLTKAFTTSQVAEVERFLDQLVGS